MKDSESTLYKLRLLLGALVGVLVLALQLCWSGRELPTWAAPEQNPYAQTVPTRPPEPTPPPAPPTQRPPEDEDDGAATPIVAGEDTSLPAEVKPPTSIVSSPTPTESAVPAGTAAIPKPDDSAATLTTTIKSGEKIQPSSLSSPSPSSTVQSTSTPQRAQPLPSPSPAPVSIDGPEQPSKITSPSYWAGWPFWLYALGLGLLLILIGVVLVNRS